MFRLYLFEPSEEGSNILEPKHVALTRYIIYKCLSDRVLPSEHLRLWYTPRR